MSIYFSLPSASFPLIEHHNTIHSLYVRHTHIHAPSPIYTMALKASLLPHCVSPSMTFRPRERREDVCRPVSRDIEYAELPYVR